MHEGRGTLALSTARRNPVAVSTANELTQCPCCRHARRRVPSGEMHSCLGVLPPAGMRCTKLSRSSLRAKHTMESIRRDAAYRKRPSRPHTTSLAHLPLLNAANGLDPSPDAEGQPSGLSSMYCSGLRRPSPSRRTSSSFAAISRVTTASGALGCSASERGPLPEGVTSNRLASESSGRAGVSVVAAAFSEYE